MLSTTKNPVKQRAGLLGARARWGDEPVAVRLDSLDPRIRAAVLALIGADQNARTTKAATSTKVTALEVDRATDHTTAG